MNNGFKEKVFAVSVVVALAIIFIPMLFNSDGKNEAEKKVSLMKEIPQAPTRVKENKDEEQLSQSNLSNTTQDEQQQNIAQNVTIKPIAEPKSQQAPIVPKTESALSMSHQQIRSDLENEQRAQEKAAQEKAAQEKAAQEKAAQEKAAQEKAVQEKAAQEKAAQEKAAQEKAVQEKAVQEKAAQVENTEKAETVAQSQSNSEHAQIARNEQKSAIIGNNDMMAHKMPSVEPKEKKSENVEKLQKIEDDGADQAVKITNKMPSDHHKGKTPKKERHIHGGWAVQLGAFAVPEHAHSLVHKLKRAGYPAFTRHSATGQGALTLVIVGPHLRKDDAYRLLASLESQFQLRGILVRYRPVGEIKENDHDF